MTTVKRKSPSLKERLEILVKQAYCPLCRGKLGLLADLHWDHIVPLALGGDNSPQNLQAVHIFCHDKKTRGVPATTAGSDIHVIAKTKRLARKEEDFRRRLMEPTPPLERQKSKWPKRSFQRKKSHGD